MKPIAVVPAQRPRYARLMYYFFTPIIIHQ